MIIILDTNIILSAVLFGGKPRQVLEAALSGRVRLCISEATISELQRVLQRPKFGFSAQLVQTIISELSALGEWVEPIQHFEIVLDDPTDNRFIDCAVAAKADYLVTGDNHLLRVGSYRSTKIVNADTFVTILAKESDQ